jgi:DNA-binding GntR family transcriptional regulator
MNLEPTLGTPMYRRIARELRHQIKAGVYGPGRRLPTELELTQRYGASRNTGGTVTYLHDTLGLTQVGYRDHILVRPPDDDESRFFDLPDDARTQVVTILRTGYRASEEGPVPFRMTSTVLPADRNQLVINAGEVPSHLAPAVDQG